MQAAYERALAALVFGPPVAAGELAAFVEQHGLGESERRAIADDFERFLVYRGLVRHTLRNALSLAIPRTMARLGPLFDEAFERFLAERGPRTHYLRDVTQELLDFVAPHWQKDPRVPPWAHELARHEALELAIASAREPLVPLALGELDAERGMAFIEACRVVRYDFAVHRLSAELEDRGEPTREPSALFAYRDREHDVRYLELSPLAALFLERLLAGESLKNAWLSASAATATDPSQALPGAARLLSDLAARGALRGQPAAGLAPEGARLENGGIEREKGNP
ncbi:MAG TPA: putative DNA-binding domain-containing protein [Polyangiaceae bacterium]|jgi:hypothetical protein|nr:putative DNA-binding domain-containing protein [Polyangiaceae bacterium]